MPTPRMLVVLSAIILVSAAGYNPAVANSEHTITSEPSTVVIGQEPSRISFLVTGQGEPEAMSATAVADLQTYATTAGGTLEHLLVKYRGKEAFAQLVTELASDPDSRFVQAGYWDSPRSDVWVRFAGRPAATTVMALQQLPYKVEVQYGANIGWAELERIAESIYSSVHQEQAVSETVMEIDALTDTINVIYKVAERSQFSRSQVTERAMASGRSVSASGTVPVRVAFTEDPGLRAIAEAIKGGHELFDPNSGSSCTSGFTVRVDGTTNGVLTSMHCPNPMRYDGAMGIIQYENAASTTSR